jgi:hypothetical protein
MNINCKSLRSETKLVKQSNSTDSEVETNSYLMGFEQLNQSFRDLYGRLSEGCSLPSAICVHRKSEFPGIYSKRKKNNLIGRAFHRSVLFMGGEQFVSSEFSICCTPVYVNCRSVTWNCLLGS